LAHAYYKGTLHIREWLVKAIHLKMKQGATDEELRAILKKHEDKWRWKE